jgi:predicted acetyltransferase
MKGIELGGADASDREQLADVLSHCFGFPKESATLWFERAGHKNLRVLRDASKVLGGLFTIPMGQFFGGREVPMVGVAGVGIRPDARGRGLAKELMLRTLAEVRDTYCISVLYPATVKLYQSVGYERAGARFRVELAPQSLVESPRASGLSLHEVPGCPEEIRASYARAARRGNGMLARGEYVWRRVYEPRDMVTKSFVVRRGEHCEGHVVLSNKMIPKGTTQVAVTDIAAHTKDAAQALISLLAAYRSIADLVGWYGAPGSALMTEIPERHHKTAITEHFMLRVLHVPQALAARGYNPLVSAHLIVAVQDPAMPGNSGTYALAVRDGAATVEPSDLPAEVTLTERGLSALYTGFQSAEELAVRGLATGNTAALHKLSALFAGPFPCMVDMF